MQKRIFQPLARLPLLVRGFHFTAWGWLNSSMKRELKGQRFGRLIVIRRVKNNKFNHTRWECKCDCGELSIVETNNLVAGRTKSCSCLKWERVRKASITHGATIGQWTREYKSYQAAKARCKYNNRNYKGRGIKMCDRWLVSFENFLADMGKCPEGCSIDRIDNDKGYEPSNCRWSDQLTQSNNRRNCNYIEYKGERMTIPRWAARLKFKATTLRGRIYLLRWSVEKAFTTPYYAKQNA